MDDTSLSADVVGTTATTTFTVERAQTTTVFGRQDTPPGRPAATDSTPAESVHVLGTAPLLSRVEFTGRESLAGEIPLGTGLVGKRATVSHVGAATVGTQVRVRTEVVAVDGADVTYDGRAQTVAEGRPVGETEVVLRLVDRDRYRRAVDDGSGAAGRE
ncbi:MAG: thioesterase family protein [Halolamina sp.]